MPTNKTEKSTEITFTLENQFRDKAKKYSLLVCHYNKAVDNDITHMPNVNSNTLTVIITAWSTEIAKELT